MEYESFNRKATIVTSDGEVTHTIEHRRDPLTGRITSVCPDLKEKWSNFVGETDRELVNTLAEESAEWCPFCQSIEKVTPEVPFAPDGRWHVNDVWVFPNLFPRTVFEAVITSSKNHFLWLDEFTSQWVENHLVAGITCIHDVFEAINLPYAVIGWNFLPPGGASLVHPHMQVSMRDIQFNYAAFIEEKSRKYYNDNNSVYWEDCIHKERTINTTGRITWMTPYAPDGFNEIWGIVNNVSNFMEVTHEDIADLATGISNTLRFYADRGCSAFNMLIYSGRLKKHENHFFMGIKLISRSNVRSTYLNIDSWYMPKLLWEDIVAESPEELAEAAREYF